MNKLETPDDLAHDTESVSRLLQELADAREALRLIADGEWNEPGARLTVREFARLALHKGEQ